MWNKTFLPLFFIAVVFILGSALKDDKEKPFRLRKLNMIWQKAQNKMSVQKLQNFRRLLEMQDRAEIRWKELKTSGGDDDGEMEAMLRLKFSRILEQFGLEDHFKDEGNEIKNNRAGPGVFSDKRLSELWESAQGLRVFNSLLTSFKLSVICDLLPVVKYLVCEEISCVRVTV